MVFRPRWQGHVTRRKPTFYFPSIAKIRFDAAGNSGDQTAASSYSGSASWNGTDRVLCVDISLLGPGVTVVSMTYGSAVCTKLGVRSTVTSFGRIESWIVKQSDSDAPAVGSNTLAVVLSGSIEFSVEWVSYTGVHQTTPTEAFDTAQATEGASPGSIQVVIFPTILNTMVHAAIVASDTSITAASTSRNNISGTLGSGANQDTGDILSYVGSTPMGYTNVAAFTTWAMAGYALRPLAAAGTAYNQAVNAACSVAASIVRAVGKPINATSTAVASVVRSCGKLVNASTSATSTIVRSCGKLINGSTSPLSSIKRALSKTVASTCTPLASIVRSTSKSIAATCSPLASVTSIKVILKAINASCSALASVVRSTGKSVNASTTPLTSLIKAISKSVASSCNAVGSSLKALIKAVGASTSPLASVRRSTAKIITKTISLIASVANASGAIRIISRPRIKGSLTVTRKKGSLY